MAEETAPPEDDGFGDDEVGRELAASIRTNQALLKGLQYEYGQRMLRAQAGEDEYPTPMELESLKKLERQIQNDKDFAQARRMTRRRSRGASGVADPE